MLQFRLDEVKLVAKNYGYITQEDTSGPVTRLKPVEKWVFVGGDLFLAEADKPQLVYLWQRPLGTSSSMAWQPVQRAIGPLVRNLTGLEEVKELSLALTGEFAPRCWLEVYPGKDWEDTGFLSDSLRFTWTKTKRGYDKGFLFSSHEELTRQAEEVMMGMISVEEFLESLAFLHDDNQDLRRFLDVVEGYRAGILSR